MISDDSRSEMLLISAKTNRKPFMGAYKASGASVSFQSVLSSGKTAKSLLNDQKFKSCRIYSPRSQKMRCIKIGWWTSSQNLQACGL